MKSSTTKTNPAATAFNICEVIRQKSLVAYFQPIMSVTGKKILGLEGLIRGLVPGSEQLIPPGRKKYILCVDFLEAPLPGS